MTRNHEKLLVAFLAGLIITGAAVFAVQPALAQVPSPVATSSLATGPAFAILALQLAPRH
jgi:hypothetical protein